MRIDLKKVLFYGVKGSLESFFNQAQQLGLVEFIDRSKLKMKELPHDIQEVFQAIKILRTLPVMKQEEPQLDGIEKRIVVLKNTLAKLEEDRKVIESRIEEIRPFGRFSLKDIELLKKETGKVFQYFFAKRGVFNEDPLICIHQDNVFDYFISWADAPLKREKLIEIDFKADLTTLEEQRKEVAAAYETAEEELKGYSKYNLHFHHLLQKKMNDFSLKSAKNTVQHGMEGALFSVEGWVPVNKLQELKVLVEKLDVQVEEILIESEDRVPTYLENKGYSKVGEDLVCFYDVPSKGDDDPSVWVLFFFALFFAVIVGDGGYGLLFLATALYLRYKNPKMEGTSRRMWKLFTLLSVSCVAWGLLTNSFFGISFGQDSMLRKVSAINWLAEKKANYHFTLKDDEYQRWIQKAPELSSATNSHEFLHGTNEMMGSFNDAALIEIALLLGTIHICLSFIRYIRRNPAGIGWLIAIVGGYFFFPSFLKANSLLHYAFGWDKVALAESGYYMIFTGIGLAVAIAVYQRKLMGILELASITAIFADILSYLRLYALGLSGSVVTSTINGIAGSIRLTFLAVVLLLVGHAINMALSIVGGVIHGLRLNFIEWYHYSFEGGGKAFDPLKRIE